MYRRRNTLHTHKYKPSQVLQTRKWHTYEGVRTFTCKGIHQYIQLTPMTLQTQDREIERLKYGTRGRYAERVEIWHKAKISKERCKKKS